MVFFVRIVVVAVVLLVVVVVFFVRIAVVAVVLLVVELRRCKGKIFFFGCKCKLRLNLQVDAT